ncbi:hypothetical protein [Actinosynnema sp. NPDC023587]|uniref:hypothetical protein n=1 Tax=Actinosynnema sp. NPDC023587 TaxID=3154695 RepID=UPI0033E06ABE
MNVASTLGISLEHLRFAFCRHPLEALPEPPDRPTRHVDQRKPIRRIAAETGHSVVTVTASLRTHGLTQFRVDRTPDVDKHWLRTQYLTRKRSLEDIARELGIRAYQVGRRAQQYGTPLRAPQARDTTDRHTYPAILGPAARSHGGRRRLLRFRETMKHRTIAEAATVLGLARQDLYPQISRIERELG